MNRWVAALLVAIVAVMIAIGAYNLGFSQGLAQKGIAPPAPA